MSVHGCARWFPCPSLSTSPPSSPRYSNASCTITSRRPTQRAPSVPKHIGCSDDRLAHSTTPRSKHPSLCDIGRTSETLALWNRLISARRSCDLMCHRAGQDDVSELLRFFEEASGRRDLYSSPSLWSKEFVGLTLLVKKIKKHPT
jgi:hypothetical protein